MYSVLLYRDAANPENVPDDWPAEVLYIPDGPNVSVNPPRVLMTNDEYNAYVNDPDRVARKQIWNDAQAGIYEPVALIKVMDVTCVTNHPVFAWIPDAHGGIGKIRIPAGMPFTAHIQMRDVGDTTTMPINDFFAMPVIGEGHPTQLFAVGVTDGVATMEMMYPNSGIYEITQDVINRELPPQSKFKFAGVRIYVVEMA
jgi:hypothetical protein